MKRFLIPILLVLCLASCHQKRDRVVAQVYNHKLYLSEVLDNMPSGLSPEDSVSLVKEYIDTWVKEKLVLYAAERNLSVREKNFDKKMEDYRNSLLINAYYDKLVSDTTSFNISQEELDAFTNDFGKRYTVDKDIVKLNYVKLAAKSALTDKVRDILFDEEKRTSEKELLVKLLGDSIEYMVDDKTWLYLDDIQAEVPFVVDDKQLLSGPQYVDMTVSGYRYLMVILEHKDRRTMNETQDERAAAKMMLVNQRKRQFIEDHVNQLYEKALKDGSIIQ